MTPEAKARQTIDALLTLEAALEQFRLIAGDLAGEAVEVA